MVEHLPAAVEALNSIPSTAKKKRKRKNIALINMVAPKWGKFVHLAFWTGQQSRL
jgi:hypothetical protein